MVVVPDSTALGTLSISGVFLGGYKDIYNLGRDCKNQGKYLTHKGGVSVAYKGGIVGLTLL